MSSDNVEITLNGRKYGRLVERLRVIHCAADDLTPCGTCLPCQAADEIERLRAEIERLRAAGDQLVDYVREAGPGLHDDMAILACWQQARRD